MDTCDTKKKLYIRLPRKESSDSYSKGINSVCVQHLMKQLMENNIKIILKNKNEVILFLA